MLKVSKDGYETINKLISLDKDILWYRGLVRLL